MIEEKEITDILENFEFPEVSLADLDLRNKIDVCTILSIYGDYCMRNRIKDSHIQNKHNPELHFISESRGRIVKLEVRHNELAEIVKMEHNPFADFYACTSRDCYELVLKDEKNTASV